MGKVKSFCEKHNVDKVYMAKLKNPYYMCVFCKKESSSIYSSQHKVERKKYRELNREKQIRYSKDYCPKNRLIKNAYDKLYMSIPSNKERRRKYIREYNKNKRRVDFKYRIDCRMSANIGRALKRNKAGRTWESLVGYTLNDLIKRLENTMPTGYTWNDLLTGELEIDHIKPKILFSYTDHNQPSFKECWGLNNLQLLTKKGNSIKRANYN